jgi:hypothetical protein
MTRRHPPKIAGSARMRPEMAALRTELVIMAGVA